MFKNYLSLLMALAFTFSCVPEELQRQVICPAIGTEHKLNLKISSNNPLPEGFGVDLNRESSGAEENCADLSGKAELRFSSDRKVAYISFTIDKNDNVYFPNFSDTPQEDYAEFDFYQRPSCSSQKLLLEARSNTVISWKKVNDLYPECDSSAYYGSSELRYNP